MGSMDRGQMVTLAPAVRATGEASLEAALVMLLHIRNRLAQVVS